MSRSPSVLATLAVAVGLAVAGVAAAGSAPAAPAPPCVASSLTVRMTVTPGSGAAGHIGYTLGVTNTGYRPCRLGTHPRLTLLRAGRRALPTHVTRVGSVGVVTVAPGRTVRSRLFFSPDVPSLGEPTSGPCEPVAHAFRLTLTAPAAGSRIGSIRPPTSVCGRGSVEEKPLR